MIRGILTKIKDRREFKRRLKRADVVISNMPCIWGRKAMKAVFKEIKLRTEMRIFMEEYSKFKQKDKKTPPIEL